MSMMPGEGAPPPAAWGGTAYATLMQRFFAYLVDLLIMGLISLPFRALLLQSRVDATATVGTILLVLVVHGLYLIGFWSRDSRTPGMRLLKLHLERADGGGSIDLRTAAVRFIPFGAAIVLYFFALAIWLWMAITVATHPRRQGIQDRIARTVVVTD